jgi:hypothetical protein
MTHTEAVVRLRALLASDTEIRPPRVLYAAPDGRHKIGQAAGGAVTSRHEINGRQGNTVTASHFPEVRDVR